MRIVLDNDCGVYEYSLHDSDADGVLKIEFEDESTGASIKIIDIYDNIVVAEFDRKELKQYLLLVLSAFEECERLT